MSRYANESSPAPRTTTCDNPDRIAARARSSANRLRAAMNHRIRCDDWSARNAGSTSLGSRPSSASATGSSKRAPPSSTRWIARWRAADSAVRLGPSNLINPACHSPAPWPGSAPAPVHLEPRTTHLARVADPYSELSATVGAYFCTQLAQPSPTRSHVRRSTGTAPPWWVLGRGLRRQH